MNIQVDSQFSKSWTNPFLSYLSYLKKRNLNGILHFKRLKELQKIINENGMNTYFQPILNLKSSETIGYEALNRPAVTNLFPSTDFFYEFIGQSNQVFLFELFCRNLSLTSFIERLDNDLHRKNTLLFINIHPHVLLDRNYHSGETIQLLTKLGIEPRQVVFELTEKCAVNDYTMFEKVLSNYRSQGFRIAIDDVGSGYNSLKTLVYLKPEFIKLDKSLIQNIDKNIEQQLLIKVILEFAKQSSTEIIAEGIERTEELNFLRKEGIHYGQGFALGKPQEEINPGRFPKDAVQMEQ